MMLNTPTKTVPNHVALKCASCPEEISKGQRSVSDFIGHHTATTACVPAEQHWHIICEPKKGMHYTSSERSKPEKAGK